MNERKQKRFTTQLDIEAEIIKQRRKLAELLSAAAKQRSAIKSNFDQANDPDNKNKSFHRQTGFDIKKELKVTGRAIDRIENIILPALKRASAEMRTPMLPLAGLEGDKGVVMQAH